MKIVIQRVKRASVSIDSELYNQIQQGLLLLVGVAPDDAQEDVEYAARKIANMRIFSDKEDKMNLSVKDVKGENLTISQFTLYAQPDLASQLYDDFNELLGREIPVKTGVFAADMQVELTNDGPVTIVLDTKNR